MPPKRHAIKQKPGPVPQHEDAPTDYQAEYRPVLMAKIQEQHRFNGPDHPGVAEPEEVDVEVPVPDIDDVIEREDGPNLYTRHAKQPEVEVAVVDEEM